MKKRIVWNYILAFIMVFGIYSALLCGIMWHTADGWEIVMSISAIVWVCVWAGLTLVNKKQMTENKEELSVENGNDTDGVSSVIEDMVEENNICETAENEKEAGQRDDGTCVIEEGDIDDEAKKMIEDLEQLLIVIENQYSDTEDEMDDIM